MARRSISMDLVDPREDPGARVDPEHGTPGTPMYVYTRPPGVLVARMRRPV